MNQWEPFSLQDVTLTDPFLVNGWDKEVAYLLSFDVDRLLAGFRETAHLSMLGKERYEGWESMLIGGHTMGHFLTAVAQAYASCQDDPEKKQRLVDMLEKIGVGLRECQEHSQGKPGFIFGAPLADPDNVEKQFDNVEEGKTNIITQAWVPWYTMHKILAGLTAAYELTGIDNLLTVACGIGDWTYDRSSKWDEALNKKVLDTEFGGMNDALYDLYRITGIERYAIAAHRFDQEALYEKIYTGGKNVLNNLHANTTIPKFMGCLNRYVTLHGKTVSGETVDATRYLKIAEAFWTMVIERHTYVTGANSEWEHFGEDNVLDRERTNCNNESCNVYNMLKLTRMLYLITGEHKYGEYYERAFINHILASQDPHTGMTMYFHPMAGGFFKVFGTPFNRFWCCTGSGMENFTKLGDSIYYHRKDTLLINLYLASTVKCEEGNIFLSQEGDLTAKPEMTFIVSALKEGEITAKLTFRKPLWLAGKMQILINDAPADAGRIREDEGFVTISGPFADGDRIRIRMPMEIRANGTNDDPSSLAFTYGPYVLSADLGCEDEEITTTGVMVSIPARAITSGETVPLPEGVSLEEFKAHPGDHMKPVKREEYPEGGPYFTLTDTGLIFAPHYKKVKERYGIYWYLKTREEMEKEEHSRETAIILDTVQPGYGQYESDELHAMEEKDTVAITHDGTSRYALEDGYFTYRMAVKKGGDNFLEVTFRKEDNGKSIHILSRHVTVYAGTLHYDGDEERYTMRLPIPGGVVDGAQTITANGEEKTVIYLTFRGMNGEASARVCDFIYIKAPV